PAAALLGRAVELRPATHRSRRGGAARARARRPGRGRPPAHPDRTGRGRARQRHGRRRARRAAGGEEDRMSGSPAPGAFTVEVDQNSYLPAGGTRVDAIVTVTATDGAAGVEVPPWSGPGGPSLGANATGGGRDLIRIRAREGPAERLLGLARSRRGRTG